MPQSPQQLESYELFKNQIASIIHQHPDWTAVRIAEYLNLPYQRVSRAKLALQKDAKVDDSPSVSVAQAAHHNLKVSDGHGFKNLLSESYRIKTVQEALEKADVNVSEWEVKSSEITSWEASVKVREGNTERVEVIPMFRIKINLIKREIEIDKVISDLLMDIRTEKPKYTPKYKKSSSGNMFEIALFDLHIGKLAWGVEVGERYDIEIASKSAINAVHDFLDRTAHEKIEKILFPIGNDLLHIDTHLGTTTKGTRVDFDSRPTKAFTAARQLYASLIRDMNEIAPVEIITVPGNHDYMSSLHLAHVLDAQFDSSKYVSVDISPCPRKYRRWGTNLLGFVHGSKDDPGMKTLPLLMAEEVKEDWSNTEVREWHVGHYHKKKELNFIVGDSANPIYIRTIPSLSTADFWHFQKGFINSGQAESFMWNKKSGLIGQWIHRAKKEESPA